MMTNFKKIKFSRFGGLSSVNQKGYDKTMPGFHSPPMNRGLYAFIWPLYEPFLLGGDYSNIMSKHSKFEYLKDKNGNYIEYNDKDDFDSNFMKKYTTILKDKKDIWIKPKKPKIFEYYGELWHHLEPKKKNEILSINGSWYLTTYKTFIKCISIEYSNFKKQERQFMGESTKNGFKKTPITIDHLEVFIEKI